MARRPLRYAAVLAALVPLLALAAPAEATTPSVYRLKDVADAKQVIAVTNRSWTSSYATLQAFEKQSNGTWRSVFGPWTARIGRNGFGSPKREGDGQSPVGSYRIPGMFGVAANPGTQYRWLRVDRSDVWVDDPYSTYYNLHMRLPANGRWRSAEPMYQPTAYAYAAVIGYNTARRPWLGSAIFLHTSTGTSTAGCVSLHASQLVPLLRWLNWYKNPRVVMGPESVVAY
ncbi:MAG TPA: L,D-transpeptidase family protein [Mycobacteriales bacterium]|jgi:L,D-peptidoglycan transpeptidase YkuD (ErfK/YbiS/YcfS/YnhG family)|nr:L,D-transpeptidase family protein [Mycobacteriales bacterium]